MRPALMIALLLLPVLPVRAAAGPEAVASIAPVHSLVARVMQGAGAPVLLIPPGSSPHGHAMRPSEAAALERADVVFWVGPGIEDWLERPLATLAGGARIVRLDAVPGLTQRPLGEADAEEDAEADAEDGGHAHADHADEAHGDEHGDEAHADEPGHETHADAAEAHGEAHGHDHAGGTDPHLWLDPENAKAWVDAIVAALAEADPANAALYAGNAAAARAELDALAAEIAAMLAPLRGRRFVVFHDAYNHFEHRFGIEAAAAVTLSDARTPGPARISAIRAAIRDTGADCVFREPQFRPALVETVAEGTGARIGVLDPVGATLAPGPGLYPALLRGIAAGLADCLG